MNTVSIFIYAADIVSNLRTVLTGLVVGALIATGVTAIPALIGKFDDMIGDGEFFDKYWLPTAKWLIPSCVACFVVIAFIPSKTTMYAIAASQVGEVALTTPEVKDAFNDTKDILRDYLKSLKKTGS